MKKINEDQIERPKSLTDIVSNRLRASVMEGDFQLGQPLSETMLANMYGVSKTPVRESLYRLKQEGVVEIIPQKGSFVFLPDEVSVNQLCDFRGYIEPYALKESYKKDRDSLIESLEITIIKMRRMLKQNNISEYLKLDTQFHQEFFNHNANPYFIEAYNLVSTKAAALRCYLSMNSAKAQQSFKEHSEIVEHLNNDDINSAIEILTRHVLNIKNAYESPDK